MKELQNKVIKLGIERGYIPSDAFDNVEEKFAIQYERLIEEIGEAFRELRLRDQDNFDNEYGDVTVLYTNCRYIINNYADVPEYVRMLDIAVDLIKVMERRASELFLRDYTRYEAWDKCLKLAYDKIISRGGMLIGEDYFKPTDPEYIKYMQENENNI